MTLHPAVVGEVTTATIATIPANTIRDSQQRTSPIGFLFWNFRHRLVRYYWYDIIWYFMILYDIIWYFMILYDIIWYMMILYDIIWYYMDIIWYYRVLKCHDIHWYTAFSHIVCHIFKINKRRTERRTGWKLVHDICSCLGHSFNLNANATLISTLDSQHLHNAHTW